MRYVVIAALLALLVVPVGNAATSECRGLNPCVPIAGPWVVVPTQRSLPRPEVQYQLTCPKGFVVAGLDAELTDPAIDLAFLGASGSPISPGVTTSNTVVFVGTYTGTKPNAPTFRPHAGCIPATGGGQRTPTGVRKIVPPGHPTTRRVVTSRVITSVPIVARCRAGEELVAWYFAMGFSGKTPPTPAVVRSLTATGRAKNNTVTVVGQARLGRGLIQVAAVCAGGQ